jgi:hypothetical protein
MLCWPMAPHAGPMRTQATPCHLSISNRKYLPLCECLITRDLGGITATSRLNPFCCRSPCRQPPLRSTAKLMRCLTWQGGRARCALC